MPNRLLTLELLELINKNMKNNRLDPNRDLCTFPAERDSIVLQTAKLSRFDLNEFVLKRSPNFKPIKLKNMQST